MIKEYICIACPIGCHLELKDEDGEIEVSGNKCPRGDKYAREEYVAPKRVVTATCKTSGGEIRIPVKTTGAILKEHIPTLLEDLYKLEVELPVERNFVLFSNYKDSGVDVVTTRSMK